MKNIKEYFKFEDFLEKDNNTYIYRIHELNIFFNTVSKQINCPLMITGSELNYKILEFVENCM